MLVGRAVAESAPVLAQLDRHPFAGRVQHRGYIPDEERAALYAGATALILPSFFEGFGLPVLEAMTVGVPVIASDRGALPEVLGDAGLLVSPDDPEELAAAMQRVVTDARLAATLRRPWRAPSADLRLDRLGDDAARNLRGVDGGRARPPQPGPGMKIAVDARELAPRPTGVGRYLLEILKVWAADRTAADCTVMVCAPTAIHLHLGEGGARLTTVVIPRSPGQLWEQLWLPLARPRVQARRAFAPAYSAPLFAPAPTCSPSTTSRSSRTRSGSGGARACAAAGRAGSPPPTRATVLTARNSRATEIVALARRPGVARARGAARRQHPRPAAGRGPARRRLAARAVRRHATQSPPSAGPRACLRAAGTGRPRAAPGTRRREPHVPAAGSDAPSRAISA